MIKKRTGVRNQCLDEIHVESKNSGYGMIERLVREWESGINSFSQENEAFFAYWDEGEICGVGGINEEPYLHVKEYGRMRHLYVLKRCRRSGSGRQIVQATVKNA